MCSCTTWWALPNYITRNKWNQHCILSNKAITCLVMEYTQCVNRPSLPPFSPLLSGRLCTLQPELSLCWASIDSIPPEIGSEDKHKSGQVSQQTPRIILSASCMYKYYTLNLYVVTFTCIKQICCVPNTYMHWVHVSGKAILSTPSHPPPGHRA